MMARLATIAIPALLLSACGSEVEPETADTPDNEMAATAATGEREAAPDVGSTYTDIADCEIVEESVQEMAYVERRCEGHAGYDLLISTSDLRDEVTLVTPEGEEEPLEFNRDIADGAFSELGKKVEWRGVTADEPRVMIARMNVANPDDPMGPDISHLAVVRLESPACIVARVPPGPGQNVAARRFADRETLPDCLGGATEQPEE